MLDNNNMQNSIDTDDSDNELYMQESIQKDYVNHPDHYMQGSIECIRYLEDSLGDGFSYYLEGSIKKYLHRWRYKNAGNHEKQVEDLKKAFFYLSALIEDQES
tara:strand:+ start:22707 stop:23015 length:309 start_codon:yes stop_codon:yes gene_type:complete